MTHIYLGWPTATLLWPKVTHCDPTHLPLSPPHLTWPLTGASSHSLRLGGGGGWWQPSVVKALDKGLSFKTSRAIPCLSLPDPCLSFTIIFRYEFKNFLKNIWIRICSSLMIWLIAASHNMPVNHIVQGTQCVISHLSKKKRLFKEI